MSGPAVRLADAGGEVAPSRVRPAGGRDFAVLDARPRPGVPAVSVLDGLPGRQCRRPGGGTAYRRGADRVPPDAEEGTVPRPEYDPAVVTLTRREQAKAAELTAAGHPVSASAIAKRRRRYQEQGLIGMIDHRAGKRMPPHGRADAAVVAAMRQAISEAAGRLDEDRGIRAAADEADPRRVRRGTGWGNAVKEHSLPPVQPAAGRPSTRPGRRAPAGRWPPALMGRSGRRPRQRPVT